MQSEYFNRLKKEHVITSLEQNRVWNNFIGSSDFALIINNQGLGYNHIIKTDSTKNCTKSENVNPKPKIVLIRDNNSGKIWSSVYQVETEIECEFQCIHGSGYTILNSEYNGIKVQTKYFVPKNEKFEIWHLNISNSTLKNRNLSFGVFENENNDFFKGFTNADSKCNGLTCLGLFGRDINSFTSNISKFINPKSLRKSNSKPNLESQNKFSIFQSDIELEPSEMLDFIVLLSPECSESKKLEIISEFGSIEAAENEFKKIITNKTCVTNAIRIF